MKTNIESRSMAMWLILTIVTFGIYHLFWVSNTARDTNEMCSGDNKETAGALKYLVFTLLTLGIYPILWWSNFANRLHYTAMHRGVRGTESGNTVLLWFVFGFLICGIGPFIGIYKAFENFNALAGAWNNRQTT